MDRKPCPLLMLQHNSLSVFRKVLCCAVVTSSCHLQRIPIHRCRDSSRGIETSDTCMTSKLSKQGKGKTLMCSSSKRENKHAGFASTPPIYTEPPLPAPHGYPIRPLFQPDFGPDTTACPFHTYARRYIYTFTPSTLPRARKKKSDIAPRVEFLITRHASP